MQFRVFAIPATGSPDLEDELNKFLRSQKIISVQKSLQLFDGIARWCFCVEYLDAGSPANAIKPSGQSRQIDYKEVLTEDDFAIYAQLRDIRKELSQKESVPVYAILTNDQLAKIATNKPKTLADLMKIEGIGTGKSEKYGAAFLRMFNLIKEPDNETNGKPN